MIQYVKFLYMPATTRGVITMKKALLLLFIIHCLTASAYNAGFKKQSLDYNGEKTEYGLWYPSETAEKKQNILIYEVSAAENGIMAERIKGTVILSHGFGGSMYGLHYLAEHLARNGYAVIAPSYPDLKGVKSKDRLMRPPVMRVQLSYAAFENLKKSGILPKNAFDRIFSAGFSLGGYTAAANAGAKPSFTRLDSYCASPDNFPILCSEGMADAETLKQMYRPIKGIKAAVLLAPALGVLFDRQSFGADIPFKIFIAEEDSMIYGQFDASYFASVIPSVKSYVVKNADHGVFAAPCSKRAEKLMPERCTGKAEKSAVHKKVAEETLELFDSKISSSLRGTQ